MNPLDEVLNVLAQSIHMKLLLLDRRESKLSKMQKNKLNQSIHSDLRHCTGLIYDDPETDLYQKPQVSQAAFERAQLTDSKLNLRNHTWKTQNKFDPGRKIFQWEHITPISELKRVCTGLSMELIVNVMKEKIRVAWILKSEDEKLRKLGYRSERPNSVLAYREAGIILRGEE